MRPRPQQIILDLNNDEDARLDPPLEPERTRQLIALMAEAIVVLMQATRRTRDDDQ